MKRLMLLVLVLIFATETPSTQREETVEIVFKAQDKQINPYQEEYEKLLYPTVRISSPTGTGSGVVISYKLKVTSYELKPETCNLQPETFILTAAHVVGDESKVEIEFFTTKNTKIDAEVLITDTDKDLALIKIRDSALPQHLYLSRLASKDYRPYLFNPVYTIGCSLGLPPRPSQGIISVIDKDHWEVSSPVLPGNSGGPVYDRYTYQVIGVAVWVKTYQGQLVTTMAGIVPINQIYEFLQPQITQMNTDKSDR
ncbi:MAG: serine protease [Planctomycetota bacterium]